MHILVVSRQSLPDRETTIPAWNYCRSLGHTVSVIQTVEKVGTKPDVIVCMGVSLQDEAFALVKRYPGTPLAVYNWDCYEYVWTNPRPREYDFRKFGELLHIADKVWVPSHCTGERTTQWWGIAPSKIERILSSVPYWDHANVEDLGYVYCALREIPDKWWGKLEQACAELRLPIIMSKHEFDYKHYQKALAACRVIVAPLYELSTGGLSLMEAYYLGKPVLINGSKWNGGADYLGDRAHYFNDCDYEDLKRKLLAIYKTPEMRVPRPDHKEYVTINFSDQRMIDDFLRSLQGILR